MSYDVGTHITFNKDASTVLVKPKKHTLYVPGTRIIFINMFEDVIKITPTLLVSKRLAGA